MVTSRWLYKQAAGPSLSLINFFIKKIKISSGR